MGKLTIKQLIVTNFNRIKWEDYTISELMQIYDYISKTKTYQKNIGKRLEKAAKMLSGSKGKGV